MFKSMNVNELYPIWLLACEKSEPFILVDVRTPEEYQQGHVPGAKLVTPDTMMEQINTFPDQGEVFLICRSGMRSAQAAIYLAKEHGCSNLTNIDGGTMAWMEAGYPIEKSSEGNDASDYGMRTIFDGDIAAAETAITEALKAVGFGILTRIDVAETLKKKIDVERTPYVILGACNPKLANHALNLEPELGLMLPCNVIVYQNEDGQTVVSIIDPAAMVGMINNSELECLVKEARPLLNQALQSI